MTFHTGYFFRPCQKTATFTDGLPIPETQPDSVLLHPLAIDAANFRWWVELYGWRFQIRGFDYHNLGSCVRRPLKHFNIEVFRNIGGGRYRYVLNVHLGKYYEGGRACFVLWESRYGVCWRLCSPTWNNLVTLLYWLLLFAAAVLAIYIAWWIALAIARILAGLMFAPLVAL